LLAMCPVSSSTTSITSQCFEWITMQNLKWRYFSCSLQENPTYNNLALPEATAWNFRF
jgi:hypothetical protein